MENILDISVILPIKNNKEKDFNEFFEKSIESLRVQEIKPKELIIVHAGDESLTSYLDSFNFEGLEVKVFKFEGEPNFASQVNFGFENSNSTWVSILEFDDEYSKIWFKHVKKYSEVYTDVDAFLPIVVDVDNKSVFAGFTNEATFASNFAQESGILTNDTLHQYQNFQISGMVIKKSVIDEFGGIKPTIKLTFGYEFLLRLTYNSAKIMTIPKLGYKHINLRPDSIFWEYKEGSQKLLEPEVKFWVATAKKEYFFKSDRNIKYSENV